MKLRKDYLVAMAVILVILIPVLATYADDKKAGKPSPAVAKSPSSVSQSNNTAYVPKLQINSPSINTPKSSFDVNKSNDTAHVPKQAEVKSLPKPEPKVETKTIMLQTWPVAVPARVPKNYEERPESPHAGENVGAAEGLGGSR